MVNWKCIWYILFIMCYVTLYNTWCDFLLYLSFIKHPTTRLSVHGELIRSIGTDVCKEDKLPLWAWCPSVRPPPSLFKGNFQTCDENPVIWLMSTWRILIAKGWTRSWCQGAEKCLSILFVLARFLPWREKKSRATASINTILNHIFIKSILWVFAWEAREVVWPCCESRVIT